MGIIRTFESIITSARLKCSLGRLADFRASLRLAAIDIPFFISYGSYCILASAVEVSIAENDSELLLMRIVSRRPFVCVILLGDVIS